MPGTQRGPQKLLRKWRYGGWRRFYHGGDATRAPAGREINRLSLHFLLPLAQHPIIHHYQGHLVLFRSQTFVGQIIGIERERERERPFAAMAPITATLTPAGIRSTAASCNDKLMKRGRSLRRSSTQRRPQHQQLLPPHLPQTMQGRQGGDEDEDAVISCHPNFQTYRHRDRQSHYIDPRQPMLHLPDSRRPASSCSHMRDWDLQRDRSRSPSYSKKLPPSDASSQHPQIEYHSSLPSSAGMTSEEFEALPPTVQRKVSTGVAVLGCLQFFFSVLSSFTHKWPHWRLHTDFLFFVVVVVSLPAFGKLMRFHMRFQETPVVSTSSCRSRMHLKAREREMA